MYMRFESQTRDFARVEVNACVQEPTPWTTAVVARRRDSKSQHKEAKKPTRAMGGVKLPAEAVLFLLSLAGCIVCREPQGQKAVIAPLRVDCDLGARRAEKEQAIEKRYGVHDLMVLNDCGDVSTKTKRSCRLTAVSSWNRARQVGA